MIWYPENRVKMSHEEEIFTDGEFVKRQGYQIRSQSSGPQGNQDIQPKNVLFLEKRTGKLVLMIIMFQSG
jgi:hypothetical protein